MKERSKVELTFKIILNVKRQWSKGFNRFGDGTMVFPFLRTMGKLKGWKINKQRILFVLKYNYMKI